MGLLLLEYERTFANVWKSRTLPVCDADWLATETSRAQVAGIILEAAISHSSLAEDEILRSFFDLPGLGEGDLCNAAVAFARHRAPMIYESFQTAQLQSTPQKVIEVTISGLSVDLELRYGHAIRVHRRTFSLPVDAPFCDLADQYGAIFKRTSSIRDWVSEVLCDPCSWPSLGDAALSLEELARAQMLRLITSALTQQERRFISDNPELFRRCIEQCVFVEDDAN
jgi:hypothetical protein